MCGLGVSEIVIILILALVLLGPKQLPDVAKQLGKALREFKKATEDLKEQFETELYSEPSKPAPPRILEPGKPPNPAEPTVVAASAAAPAPPASHVDPVPVAAQPQASVAGPQGEQQPPVKPA